MHSNSIPNKCLLKTNCQLGESLEVQDRIRQKRMQEFKSASKWKTCFYLQWLHFYTKELDIIILGQCFHFSSVWSTYQEFSIVIQGSTYFKYLPMILKKILASPIYELSRNKLHMELFSLLLLALLICFIFTFTLITVPTFIVQKVHFQIPEIKHGRMKTQRMWAVVMWHFYKHCLKI